MNTESIHFSLEGCSLEPMPTVRVLIIYEDQATGLRAKEVYDRMSRQFGGDCRFEQTMWKGEVLTVRRLREQAAEESCEADMVLLSLHGDGEVPAWLERWSEAWLSEHWKEDAALIALFDPGSGAALGGGEMRAFVEHIARRGRMVFIPQTMSAPEEPPMEVQPGRSALAGVNAYEDYRFQARDAWPRWGINE